MHGAETAGQQARLGHGNHQAAVGEDKPEGGGVRGRDGEGSRADVGDVEHEAEAVVEGGDGGREGVVGSGVEVRERGGDEEDADAGEDEGDDDGDGAGGDVLLGLGWWGVEVRGVVGGGSEWV